MKRIQLSLLKVVLLLASLFCVLRYWAKFSSTQSGVLTVIGFLIYGLIAPLKEERPPFVPYSIFVRPNFRAILIDFDLIVESEEAWADLWTGVSKVPKAHWNVWDSGFAISFVTPDLAYTSALNSFATEVDMFASLEPISIGDEGPLIWHEQEEYGMPIHSYAPSLRLQTLGCRDAVTIAIEIRDSHWERIRTKEVFREMPKSYVTTDHECGVVKVVLAVIPREEFEVHLGSRPGDYYEMGKAYEAIVRQRTQARAKYGWKGKPETDTYGTETPADLSNVAVHKYFEVSHGAL